MRPSLLTSPRWAVAVAAGVAAGVVVGVVAMVFTSMPWSAAVACGVLAGAVAGSGIDASARMQREQVRTAVGDLPPDQLLAAVRATRSHAAVADPVIRAAALRILQHRLALVPSKAVLVLFSPVPAVTALATSGVMGAPEWTTWFIAGLTLLSGLCAGVLAWQAFYLPRRLTERIRLLTAADVS